MNRKSGYGFLLTAIDGQLDAPDRFRIKIWHLASGSTLYDNHIGTNEDSDVATPLGGGSITVRRSQ